MTYCSLICTHESFRPSDCSRVRWLDWEQDYPLAQAYWPQDPPLTREDWEQNRADGFRYCAIVEHEAIAALAAVWTYSETHWEVAAVSTAPAFRQRGYGKAVVCFATAHILEQGRKATILTDNTNVAMLKTAESVGFYRSDERGKEKEESAFTREEMKMTRTLGLIGVPSSAGAHAPGQEKAPQYLRHAGLVERLEAAGIRLVDHGDLPRVRFRPDKAHRRQQNVTTVLEVATHVAEQVDLALQGRETLLVLGGDCTIELGVLSGALRHGEDLGLLYFDANTDLNIPASVTGGFLDWMGMAHMLGEAGAVEELSHIGPRFPLLTDDKVIFFAYVPGELTAWEQTVFVRRSLHGYVADHVVGRARDAAVEAVAAMEKRAERFLVHFDVDVIDFLDFPIADFPQPNAVLTFQEAMACLEVFVSSPKCVGLTITEFNPDHADEDGVFVATFVEGVVSAFARVKR